MISYITTLSYFAECGNCSANEPIVSKQQCSKGIKLSVYCDSSRANEKCSLTNLQVSSAPKRNGKLKDFIRSQHSNE